MSGFFVEHPEAAGEDAEQVAVVAWDDLTVMCVRSAGSLNFRTIPQQLPYPRLDAALGLRMARFGAAVRVEPAIDPEARRPRPGLSTSSSGGQR